MPQNVDPHGGTYESVRNFLFHEAQLLDDRRLAEWLELVDEQIRYVIPLRVTVEKGGGTGISQAMSLMDDDLASLKMRVLRLGTEFAWAENPPSRTRHFVSNIRVRDAEQGNAGGSAALAVSSNLLLFRSRFDSPHYDLLSGERHDLLRPVGDGYRLLRREVVLDQSTVGSHNISIIL